MRSPGPSFDLRAALIAEVRAAIGELEAEKLEPKVVHRARVRLKRARALARVGRVAAPGLAELFNDSARACMHALAPARDAAALAEAARAAAVREGKKTGQALGAAADALECELHTLSPAEIDSIKNGLRDLAALAQVWPEASTRQIRRGANRLVRRAKRARKTAMGADAAETRHVWRKREKQRLYAAEILGPAWPRKRKRRVSEKLANTLGDERDARLLSARLQDAPAQNHAERALKALKRRRKQLARRANKLGRKLSGA